MDTTPSHIHITRKEKTIGILLCVILICTLIINIVVTRYSAPFIYTDVATVPQAKTALILGAAVYKNGALTPILYDRAQTALELYKSGKVSNILISGDNSTLDHNEVIPVSKFLISQGVPSGAIFLDYAGFDTYDSMYRARDIFKVTSLIIVTQRFHESRSVYIARHLGIDAVGFVADKRSYGLRNNVREFLATLKAFFDVYLHSKPTYLGAPIPIDSTAGNVPK